MFCYEYLVYLYGYLYRNKKIDGLKTVHVKKIDTLFLAKIFANKVFNHLFRST